MDGLEISLLVLGGLVLFLYAVSNLGEQIQHIVGDRSKLWLEKFTRNTLTGILTGAVVTTILDSSSAVIIITIVLVNSRLIEFRQAIGIVLGANIGTTVSSQIIALDVGRFSPILLITGLVFMFISKSHQLTSVGRGILYFGMLFFGLYTMERAVVPLKNYNGFMAWMHGLENPVRGTLCGGLVTLIIQSSSATVGMAITLAKKGLMTLPAGVAVMLGAELGTCSDTLLATIRSNRSALKTGLFHFFFNLTTITIGLSLFTPFLHLVEWVSGNVPLEKLVANAHMLFNFLGVSLIYPFVPMVEKLFNQLLPDK